MPRDIDQFDHFQAQGVVTNPSDGDDILTVDVTREAYVTLVRANATEAADFDIVVRDQDDTNASTEGWLNVSSADGDDEMDGELNDPVLHVPANKRLAIESDGGGSSGNDHQAMLVLYERHQ